MSLLLALDATQIVLIVLIGLLVIAYPLLMLRRNKKETQRMTEQTNSLKRGDKVLTSSGVYGTIVDIKLDGTAKQITIETGTDKFKSYMTIDAYAIYQVIKDEPKVASAVSVPASPVEEKPAQKTEEKQEKPAEEKKAPARKKAANKKEEAQPEQKAEKQTEKAMAQPKTQKKQAEKPKAKKK